MSTTWKPLSVGDGVIGAEVEHSPEEEAELQRKRTENATPEMIEFSLRMARESKESIQRALKGKTMHEWYLESQGKLQDTEPKADEPEEVA